MQSKRLHSLTWQNGTKFGQDQKVEFKKSFELYYQISLKDFTKVGLHFVKAAWTGSEWNEYNDTSMIQLYKNSHLWLFSKSVKHALKLISNSFFFASEKLL